MNKSQDLIFGKYVAIRCNKKYQLLTSLYKKPVGNSISFKNNYKSSSIKFKQIQLVVLKLKSKIIKNRTN